MFCINKKEYSVGFSQEQVVSAACSFPILGERCRETERTVASGGIKNTGLGHILPEARRGARHCQEKARSGCMQGKVEVSGVNTARLLGKSFRGIDAVYCPVSPETLSPFCLSYRLAALAVLIKMSSTY